MATLKDVTAAMRRIAQIDQGKLVGAAADRALLDFARAQFRTHGAAGGKPWAHYAQEPRYERYKQALGASPEPLRWQPGTRERLFPALTTARHPLRSWRPGPQGWTLDVRLPYLARIEAGGTNQFGERAPGRPIFPRARVAPAVRGDVAQAFYAEVAKKWL